MSNSTYDDINKAADYALKSRSARLVYQTYGQAVMAYKLDAISKTQFFALTELLVKNGLNNPQAGLE